MSDQIKPIMTRYNGYRFRSRLEARWAVFLDHLGIEWHYEQEGYVLHTGERYLPDFWLPKERCFLEIKGSELTERDQLRAEMLAAALKRPVYVFIGSVGDNRILALQGKELLDEETDRWWRVDSTDQARRHLEIDPFGEELAFPGHTYVGNYATAHEHFVAVDVDTSTGSLALWRAEQAFSQENFTDQWGRRHELVIPTKDFFMELVVAGDEEVVAWFEPDEFPGVSKAAQEATAAARSARFEFGESGAG